MRTLVVDREVSIPKVFATMKSSGEPSREPSLGENHDPRSNRDLEQNGSPGWSDFIPQSGSAHGTCMALVGDMSRRGWFWSISQATRLAASWRESARTQVGSQ